MDQFSRFILQLQAFRSPNVFNPWRESDRKNDCGTQAPAIRRRQLEHFLRVRAKSARYCFLGEAVGYQGGHFSGMAMMSERILLGHCRERGLCPEDILPDLQPVRTSKPKVQPQGFNEPTATIVWDFIKKSGRSPLEFLTWNSFAWHPYHSKKGMLSNRRPTLKEMEAGLDALKNFLKLFPDLKLIALGRVAEICLAKLGIQAECVRHPAMGGASKFREQTKKLLSD